MGILPSSFSRTKPTADAQTQTLQTRDNSTQTNDVIVISDDENFIEISSPDPAYSPATTPLSFLSSITTPSPPSSDGSDNDIPRPRPSLIPSRREAARRVAKWSKT